MHDGQLTAANALALGIAAVKRKEYAAAITLLSTIYGPGKTGQPPDGLSYYALALARGQGKYKTAIQYADLALKQQFYTAEHVINLSEIYLGAKSRRKAVEVLEKGLARFPTDPVLLGYRDQIGYRAPSLIPVVSRDHSLNQFLGKSGLRDRLRRFRIPPKFWTALLVTFLAGYGGFLYWLFHKLVK